MTTYPLEITVEEAKHLLDTSGDRVQLIDVREDDEVQLCRIPGALHIPMQQIPENLPVLPRDKHLLIHCHHGGRSLRVTKWLRANGLSAVSNVAGGIHEWAELCDNSIPRY